MSTAAPLLTLAAKPQPLSLSAHSSLLLQRKCACGSPTASLTGECAECTCKKRIQTKLTIGASNDPLEQEADRVADLVMSAPAHSAVGSRSPRIQRFTGHSNGDAGAAPASVDLALSSSGRPLEAALRSDMEQRFGHDFSNVRVHSDAAASLSARDVNAQAYTVGRHLVFGAGRYAPATHQGQRLVAHELAHVLQQTGGDPLASGNNTSSAVAASGFASSVSAVQRKPDDEPISLHKSFYPGAQVYDDLLTEAGKIYHWLRKNLASSPERTALETQLAQIIQTANRLGRRKGYAPLAFVDFTLTSKSPEQIDALNKLNSQSQPQTPSPFLQAPKASAPPERKPAVVMPAYLNWQPLFLEGLSTGLQSDAKLQAGWATLKAQLASPDGQLSFASGSAAGVVPGALVAVADIPYSLVKAYVEFSLQTNFGHLTNEQSEAIAEVFAGLRKFVARIPDLLTEVANEPKQVGGWAAGLISGKIREDLFLEEPDKKAAADHATKTDKSADPFGLAGIKLPDLYKSSQDWLMRGKPGEKGRFIFNKGVACGMALGYTLMNIAMLFIGPEEMAGKAASISAKGLEALKAGGLWRRIGTIAESIPELKGLLSAKRAATEAKAVTVAAKEGEALAGVVKAAGSEASLGKLEADAVALVEKNPDLVRGKEPGRRRARISPEHEIVEVQAAGGGIGVDALTLFVPIGKLGTIIGRPAVQVVSRGGRTVAAAMMLGLRETAPTAFAGIASRSATVLVEEQVVDQVASRAISQTTNHAIIEFAQQPMKQVATRAAGASAEDVGSGAAMQAFARTVKVTVVDSAGGKIVSTLTTPTKDAALDQLIDEAFGQTFNVSASQAAGTATQGVVSTTPEIAAGFTHLEVAAFRRVLGRAFDTEDIRFLQQLWDAAARPGDAAILNAGNSRYLFGLHRNRFWTQVRSNPEAFEFFTEVLGCKFSGGAPYYILNGRRITITIDHIIERQSAANLALTASNLRLVFSRENSVVLRLLNQLDPFQ
jgi:hypothetical protein